MFTFISVDSTVLYSVFDHNKMLVSVAHDDNEHKSGLYLSISTVYTMSMQFHFRMKFLLGHKPKVKCTHQTGDEFNPEFVTILTKLAMNLIQNLSQLTNTRW